MSFEDAFYSVVSTDSGLLAQQSTRVYPGQLPISPTLPASAYFVVTGDEQTAHDGGLNVYNIAARIDCYAATYDACKALRDAYMALSGQRFSTAYGKFNSAMVRQQAYEYVAALNQHRFILDGRFLFNTN